MAGRRRGPAFDAIVAFVATWVVLMPPMAVAEAGLRVDAAPGLAVIGGFFVPIVLVGAALGWAAGRSRRSAAQGVLAALLLGIAPGHNIPFLAGTAAVPTELVILAVVSGVAAPTLAVAGWALAPKVPQSAGVLTR